MIPDSFILPHHRVIKAVSNEEDLNMSDAELVDEIKQFAVRLQKVRLL